MSTTTQASKKTQFQITYNGPTLPFDYKPHKHTEELYKDTFKAFSVPEGEQEALVIYLPDNTTEVPRTGTEEDAHVQPDTTLILRGRVAGGGF